MATPETRPSDPRPPEPRPPEPRQRWRAVLRRPAEAAPDQRALASAVVAGLAAAGIAVATVKGRPSVVLAAPLAAGLSGEAELLDVTLLERLPLAAMRDALVGTLPDGTTLVALHDVWLGEPTLGAQIAAADHRIELASPLAAVDLAAVAAACAALLAADRIPRHRARAGGEVEYDLRPLLLDVGVDGPAALRVRTRIDPERGTGRPEEVLAALRDATGLPLESSAIVRTRILLAGELR